DALVEAVPQVVQLRPQGEAVAGQAVAGVALLDAVDHAVHTALGGAEAEVGGAIDQRVEIEVGAGADQLDVEAVRLVEGFAAGEFEDLQVGGYAFDGEGDLGGISVQEHAVLSL